MKLGFISILKVLIVVLATQSAWASTAPNAQLTPGVICTAQDQNFSGYYYSEHIARCKRNVSNQEKQEVAKEYGGILPAEWPQYEFDHLIPLCAGGSDDIKNLWPQPIAEAHQKDKLEDEICLGMQAGTITQAQALQKVKDWFKQTAGVEVLTDLDQQ